MRVSPEVELEGLDVPEMGGHGYPEIQARARWCTAWVTLRRKPQPVMAGMIATERGR